MTSAFRVNFVLIASANRRDTSHNEEIIYKRLLERHETQSLSE